MELIPVTPSTTTSSKLAISFAFLYTISDLPESYSFIQIDIWVNCRGVDTVSKDEFSLSFRAFVIIKEQGRGVISDILNSQGWLSFIYFRGSQLSDCFVAIFQR